MAFLAYAASHDQRSPKIRQAPGAEAPAPANDLMGEISRFAADALSGHSPAGDEGSQSASPVSFRRTSCIPVGILRRHGTSLVSPDRASPRPISPKPETS